MNDITRILSAIDAGDPQASERLLPLVYEELRQLAAHKLAQEAPGQTLEATALVHEAYLRLVGQDQSQSYQDRGHFFAAAAAAMRHILIDNARRKLTQKRGGGFQRQDLDAIVAPAPDNELVALDEALRKLAATDPAKAKLVEQEDFCGLTSEEAAAGLGYILEHSGPSLGIRPCLAASRGPRPLTRTNPSFGRSLAVRHRIFGLPLFHRWPV